MEIKKVLVIGAGQMGGGIAQVIAQAGYEVLLNDYKVENIEQRISFIGGLLAKNVEKGRMTEEEKEATLSKIKVCADYSDIKDVDLVVEAIVENMDVKKELLVKLSEALNDEAIFASNTSSLSITELATAYKDPSKVIGMHFFNPVPVMKLVELIRGIGTSDETYQAVKVLGEKIGKTTVEIKDFPGFAVNRILIPMLNEAINTLYTGVATVEDIDNSMKLGANHPMGPLALADFIGLDTVLSILEVLYKGFGDQKYAPSPLLRNYVRAGWLGKKTGKGFYDYSK
ncbi:MAG: 3-hydroxybutyryl-CoA dehydrogenase [Tissierellia bacterium]|nr:3-hydroxybutyryl-CoA dehydrogenase [Tissierellia bacterium]